MILPFTDTPPIGAYWYHDVSKFQRQQSIIIDEQDG